MAKSSKVDFEAPQIIPHLAYTSTCNFYSVKWIPSSARIFASGCANGDKGIIQVLDVSDKEIIEERDYKFPSIIRCGTFRASSDPNRHFAFGCSDGSLNIIDVNRLDKIIYTAKAHTKIINTIDGIGGMKVGEGAPELVTGSADSHVNVWDPRQRDKPVLNIAPNEDSHHPDCWAVAFGNAYNTHERTVAAGFDNGDLNVFDLRTSRILYKTNVRRGVTTIDFDRPDIKMNNMVAGTMESKLYSWNLRNTNSSTSFPKPLISDFKPNFGTVWCVNHLPQNRDVFMTTSGNGATTLFRYSYPTSTSYKDGSDNLGQIKEIHSITPSNMQPIIDFDWNSDVSGLAVTYSLDQTVRTILVTRVHSIM